MWFFFVYINRLVDSLLTVIVRNLLGTNIRLTAEKWGSVITINKLLQFLRQHLLPRNVKYMHILVKITNFWDCPGYHCSKSAVAWDIATICWPSYSSLSSLNNVFKLLLGVRLLLGRRVFHNFTTNLNSHKNRVVYGIHVNICTK